MNDIKTAPALGSAPVIYLVMLLHRRGPYLFLAGGQLLQDDHRVPDEQAGVPQNG